MSPSNNHPYAPLEPGAIRVVRYQANSTADDLRCSLTHLPDYRADGALAYVALSYCWGDASDTKTIILDDQKFYITASLWEALHSLWSQQDVYLWIDAICINQSDTEERSAQVGQMWQIFGSAATVFSWLGLKDEDTDLIFDAAAPLQEELFSLHIQTQASNPPILSLETNGPFELTVSEASGASHLKASETGPSCSTEGLGATFRSKAWGLPMMKLCSREYFGRCWIIPEILQARGVVLVCGNRWMAWATFQFIVLQTQSLWGFVCKDLATHIHEKPALLQACKICEVIVMLNTSGEYPDPVEVFYDALGFYCISKCTDVRDHIFALLSDPRVRQLDLLEALRADYSLTPEELSVIVMAQLTSLIVARDGLPGQVYDLALGHVVLGLELDLNSQTYFDWLKPQIMSIHETSRTAAGNAVYMIDLKSGLSIYLDTFQLRKLRKDPLWGPYITSPADKWGGFKDDDGAIDLEDISDTALVSVVRDPHNGNFLMIADTADAKMNIGLKPRVETG